MTAKNFAIRNSNFGSDLEAHTIYESVYRIAKSIVSGRIEHELLTDLSLILEELNTFLSAQELEDLSQALRNGEVEERRVALEADIAAQLRVYADQIGLVDPQLGLIKAAAFDFFANKDPSLVSKKLNSSASFLIYLRDLAFDIAIFIQKSVGDSLEDFLDLVQKKQELLEVKAKTLKLNKQEIRAAKDFLHISAALVLLHKVELVADDYLKSETDLDMASGQVWASRYHRGDYIPFMLAALDTLRDKFPFIFITKITAEKLNSIRVKLKVERITHSSSIRSPESIPLRTRLQEIRAIFGIALNLIFTERKSSLRLLVQILDNKTVQALESEERPSTEIKQKISRVRFYVQLLSALSQMPEYAKSNLNETNSEINGRLEKTLNTLDKIFLKAKFELEVVGLSPLALGIEGLKHGTLEGLSNWVASILSREQAYFKYLAAEKLGMFEQAYKFFSDFLLQPLQIEGESFSKLSDESFINSRTGASEASFFFSAKINVFSKRLITQICAALRQNPFMVKDFCQGLPVLTRIAAEFQDFDRGTALMLAHRHFLLELFRAGLLPKGFELLVDIVDAEVRYRHGLKSPNAIVPQISAVEWLEKNSPSSIALKSDIPHSSNLFEAMTECSETTIANAISGQFMSAQIRLLSALVASSKSKRWAKSLVKLVLSRVVERLIISEDELIWFRKLSAEYSVLDQRNKSQRDSLTILKLREIESRALTATQMLLDCSLSCAFLGDDKINKKILEFCECHFGQILPGLPDTIKWILGSNSVEEFRRRLEKSMRLVEEEAGADSLLYKPDSSGAVLGFIKLEPTGSSSNFRVKELFSSLALVSHLRRRQIVAGRCTTLERYQEAYHSLKLQNLFISGLFAINDSLSSERRASKP